MSTRALAAEALVQVLFERRSLNAVLPQCLAQIPSSDKQASERALAQEMCYGVLRWQPRLTAILQHLMHKPLKPRDADIHTLLLLGLYQLFYMRTPVHAAVTETVTAVKVLNKAWASGLVNAVLRGYVRDAPRIATEVDRDDAAAYAHPAWLLNAIKTAQPSHWQAIVTANNQHPPMTLRVNARHMDRAAYLQALHAAGIEAHAALHTSHGITLAQPMDVERLPGFRDGWVSVQDAAAQLAAPLINVQSGQRLLDACAAPGGKTAHILESQPGDVQGCTSVAGGRSKKCSCIFDTSTIHGGRMPGAAIALTALDNDGQRLKRVGETLQRLGLDIDGSARVQQGDAATPATWWDGIPFDSILLDAPCSATGVIRRHADIKTLRRAEDITALAEQQTRILEALWPLLRPEKEGGGMLLYVTCSILPQENQQQMIRFLANHTDAHEQPIIADWGHPMEVGRQILPGEDGMDGFYYARLIKAQPQ